MKNVQIPIELFTALIRYHFFGDDDCEQKIQMELENKLNAMVLRELYSKSKTDPTEEERERARQEYLNRCGIPESYRW